MRDKCPDCGAREGDGFVLARQMTGGMRDMVGDADFCAACGWEDRGDEPAMSDPGELRR